ncbi:MAG: DsbA family protein [Ginsengibacter sp.]
MATLIYCYDAYCGWCYGFSEVMKKINDDFKSVLEIEVLSGGMILPEEPVHIAATAEYIKGAYHVVEETTGVKFGSDYLWHINHPNQSDWFPDSKKAAIAMCIFKELHPELQVSFASDLQYSLHYEGRDLTDDEAYRHLLIKYDLDEEMFYEKLRDELYEEQAQYEFALCKQLKVTGFPAVLLQLSDVKFFLLARGYTPYEELKKRIETCLKENERS